MPDFRIRYGYDAQTRTFLTYGDDRHLVTIGPTRSGKGATTIVPALLHAPHSMLVIDPKGQLAAITARHRRKFGKVFVMNPFRQHTRLPWKLACHRYNPLARLDIHSPNVFAEVAALSQALIVTQGREPYFDDTARNLVATLILFLISTLGRKATLGHMRKMLTDLSARGKAAAELLTQIGNSPYAFISQPIQRFKDAEAREINSAISTAITQTAFLDDPAMTDVARGGALTASDFDLMQLKHEPITVYLILPGGYMDSYQRFLRLIITSAIEQLTSEPGGYPVLMILDEFARLENLPAVTNAFGFAAGFNLQLWPFLQDLPQLEELYGKKSMSILANCGLTQFYTPTELQTAEFLQRRGGMTTGETRSRTMAGVFGTVRSESRSEARVPLLPVENLMSLVPDKSIAFFAGTHDPVIAGRTPYWEIPALAGLYDPDPYHPL